MEPVVEMGAWNTLYDVLRYIEVAMERVRLPVSVLTRPRDGLDLAAWIADVKPADCGGSKVNKTLFFRYALAALWYTRVNGGTHEEVLLTNPFHNSSLRIVARSGLLVIAAAGDAVIPGTQPD